MSERRKAVCSAALMSPGSYLLSRDLSSDYHRRSKVSLPGSGWDRVGPLGCDHQASACLSCVPLAALAYAWQAACPVVFLRGEVLLLLVCRLYPCVWLSLRVGIREVMGCFGGIDVLSRFEVCSA